MITIYRGKTYVNCVPEEVLVQWIKNNIRAFTEDGIIGDSISDDVCFQIASARGYVFKREKKLTVK